MSIHVFGAILTHHGAAANNRAETEGNITTLQKLMWLGRVHSSVSAEAIRFALRRRLGEVEPTNRTWDEETRVNNWKDAAFTAWGKGKKGDPYIDDDLLGFMKPKASGQDGSDKAAAEEEEESGEKPKAKKSTGPSGKFRRGALEITRAISLTPFHGDTTFNAASPGATRAASKGDNTALYGTEVHATRYQYGFAMTPASLRVPSRAATAVEALCALGEVAGNHARFLYDFSPESAIFRVTHDPAPRLLYAFQEDKNHNITAPALVARVAAGDLPPDELIIAGAYALTDEAKRLGATLEPGIRKAARLVCERLASGGTRS